MICADNFYLKNNKCQASTIKITEKFLEMNLAQFVSPAKIVNVQNTCLTFDTKGVCVECRN